MTRRSSLSAVALLLLVSATALLVWRWQVLAQQRVELIRLRLQQHEAESLRAANERLAADVPLEELETLRRGREELVQLQEAVFALQNRKRAEEEAAAKARREALPPLDQPMKFAANWTFAGTATPRATLETFLWAAARGETGALATLLCLDSYAQKKLDAAFAALSPEERARFGDPAAALASFAASKFPRNLSGVGIVSETEWAKDETLLRIHLQSTDDRVRETSFKFRRNDTGWTVIVPMHMIAAFTESLQPDDASPQ